MTAARTELLQHLRLTRISAAIALTASLLAGPAYPALSQEPALPAGARAMSAPELYRLYRNKSWRWENGAGLMKDEGRKFKAWGEGEKGRTWAEGRWAITETGQMCLVATWHTSDGAFPAKTCFSHRIDAGNVYQKREPDGSWYVFRHAEPREDDEARKLVPVDLVSERLDNIQAALGAAMFPEQ